MKNLFKILGGIFALLFLVSAIVQYNDPDPYVWIAIYLLAAIVSAAFVWNKISFRVPLLLGILALVGFFYVFPNQFQGFTIGEGEISEIEKGREAFGLLIIAVIMFAYALRIRLEKKSKI